jgi:signal transduction histidine kinase/low affinity Fe/Cu permease
MIIVYILLILIFIILSVFVFLKNPKSLLNIFFSFFNIFISIWVFSLYLFLNANEDTVLFLGRFNFTSTAVIAYLGFYFGYFFPVKIFRFKKIFHLSLILWLFILVNLCMVTSFVSVEEIITNDGIKTVFGRGYLVFIVHFIVLISATAILPIIKYRHLNSKQKQQVKYFGMGTLLSILFSIFTNMVFPYVFGIYDYQMYGPLAMLFYLFFTSYAIVKHQLLDIRVVIQRSLVYSILLGFIIIVYLLLVFIASALFEYSNNFNALMAGLSASIIGIFGVPVLKNYFIRVSDKFFFKDKYDYSKALLGLSEIINNNIELDKLLIKLSSKLREILKVSSANITLPDSKKTFDSEGNVRLPREDFPEMLVDMIEKRNNPILKKEDFPMLIEKYKRENKDSQNLKTLEEYQKISIKYGLEIFVAIKIENKLIGLISLSKKFSGDDYSNEDINLLKTLSNQAGIAIEKSKLYQRVKMYSEDLERKVVERTTKISGLQEEQKQMMQEMAHGLQTPLTIFKGELAQLREELKDDKKILSIERSIDRISTFIYDMLKLAKLESEGKDFKKEEFSLSELMSGLVESFEIITKEKGIKIKHSIQPGLSFVGDYRAIEEMITNIVSNSVKYLHDDGEKTIKIKLYIENNKIIISIVDNGIGIAKENISKLFSRFHRLDNGKNEKNGTGLGLVISKKIAEKHNGKISIESELNKGTNIKIVFPVSNKN